jgi:hypothetical protein
MVFWLAEVEMLCYLTALLVSVGTLAESPEQVVYFVMMLCLAETHLP